MLYIPVISKTKLSNNVLIERALPTPGELTAVEGAVVEPFEKIGSCKFSYASTQYPESMRLARKGNANGFYKAASKLGLDGKKAVMAPYNGFLSKTEQGYIFKEEETEYTLLAGVWGTVTKKLDSYSVLINTQMLDILLVCATSDACAGELVVFPNPSDLLTPHYLEKYTKDAFGKIIYVGNHADLQLIQKAAGYGAKAVLAGSTTRAAFSYAKRNGLCLGITEGFGVLSTSCVVYDAISPISNRLVFFQGDKYQLRIPMPESFAKPTKIASAFVPVKKGLQVQVLQNPYFGEIATVDSVKGNSIFVELPKAGKQVEVKVPNVLALS